jgi:hypothetical protein
MPLLAAIRTYYFYAHICTFDRTTAADTVSGLLAYAEAAHENSDGFHQETRIGKNS